jgi:hypothetical protein
MRKGEKNAKEERKTRSEMSRQQKPVGTVWKSSSSILETGIKPLQMELKKNRLKLFFEPWTNAFGRDALLAEELDGHSWSYSVRRVKNHATK